MTAYLVNRRLSTQAAKTSILVERINWFLSKRPGRVIVTEHTGSIVMLFSRFIGHFLTLFDKRGHRMSIIRSFDEPS